MVKKEENPTGSPDRISWHPAFVQAMRLELEPYKSILKFISEHQLTAEPQRVDLIIIMKEPGTVIDKNFAQAFRSVNIVEYKSPEDHFSAWDFYKVRGYADQYAYQNKVNMRDMTITIVATRHPRELLKFFREDKDCAVTEDFPGIYRIAGYRIGIQIIETKKLAPEDNLWLRGLNRGLNAETAGSIIEASRGKYEPDIAAYLYAVLLANAKILEEALKMNKTGETTLDEVLERIGLTAKWEAQGRAEGEQTAWEKVAAMLEQGYTADQLKRMVPSGIGKR
jgi:hypothetical protein